MFGIFFLIKKIFIQKMKYIIKLYMSFSVKKIFFEYKFYKIAALWYIQKIIFLKSWSEACSITSVIFILEQKKILLNSHINS